MKKFGKLQSVNADFHRKMIASAQARERTLTINARVKLEAHMAAKKMEVAK